MNVATKVQPVVAPITPGTMKALVYLGSGKKALEDRPKPHIEAPTDAIVKITKTTIRLAHPQG